MGFIRLPSKMIRLEKNVIVPTSVFGKSGRSNVSPLKGAPSQHGRHDGARSKTPKSVSLLGGAADGGPGISSHGYGSVSANSSSSSSSSSSGSGSSSVSTKESQKTERFDSLVPGGSRKPSRIGPDTMTGSRHGVKDALISSRHGMRDTLAGSRHGGLDGRSRHGAMMATMMPRTPLKEQGLKEQLTSNTFIHVTIFFVVTSFWANFIVGTIDVQLGDSMLLLSEVDLQLYGRLFAVIMACGAFAIPVVGYLMDTVGFPATSAITVGLGSTWALLMLFDDVHALLPSFVFYSLFRVFLFTFLFAYLADSLGFRYFGVLAGLMFVTGGFIGLLQYPLAQWAAGTCHLATSPVGKIHCSRGMWSGINLVMAISLLSMFWFSYRDWVRRRRHAQVVAQVQAVSTRQGQVSRSNSRSNSRIGVGGLTSSGKGPSKADLEAALSSIGSNQDQGSISRRNPLSTSSKYTELADNDRFQAIAKSVAQELASDGSQRESKVSSPWGWGAGK
jgi:hypothetical protein